MNTRIAVGQVGDEWDDNTPLPDLPAPTPSASTGGTLNKNAIALTLVALGLYLAVMGE